MEQVRAIAQIIWQQRFWVLSFIAVSTIVACWYLASGDIDSRFSKRLSAISGQFNQVKGIRNEPFHPNDSVTDANRAQTVLESKDVYKVWKDLYELQHSEVLHWPNDLGPEFVKKMEGRKFFDPIDQEMRSIYGEFIEKQFDELLKIVKAKKSNGGRSATNTRFRPEGRPGNSNSTIEEEDDYLVEWLDQRNLSARLSFESMPTDEQIWVTQEDLWVYETLLHVIARTNEQRNATRPDNTAVRVISQLQVGSLAINTSSPPGDIYKPQEVGGSTAPGRGGGFAPERGGGYAAERGGGFSPGGLAEERGEGVISTEASVLEERYLGPGGKPLSGGSLGSEYRQLPIHMRLKMDQRFLPQLLIECANAPLPIDVKWVRVNPEKSQNIPIDRTNNSEIDGNLATVEVQGVVLIYGEPNKQLLMVPGAEEELAEEEDLKEEVEDLAVAPNSSS